VDVNTETIHISTSDKFTVVHKGSHTQYPGAI